MHDEDMNTRICDVCNTVKEVHGYSWPCEFVCRSCAVKEGRIRPAEGSPLAGYVILVAFVITALLSFVAGVWVAK